MRTLASFLVSVHDDAVHCRPLLVVYWRQDECAVEYCGLRVIRASSLRSNPEAPVIYEADGGRSCGQSQRQRT